MVRNVWDNPNNYHPCQKKSYQIYASMLPGGSCVANKLEQPRLCNTIRDCVNNSGIISNAIKEGRINLRGSDRASKSDDTINVINEMIKTFCINPKAPVLINGLRKDECERLINEYGLSSPGFKWFALDKYKNGHTNAEKYGQSISAVFLDFCYFIEKLSGTKLYKTDINTPITLCGTVGELWNVSLKTFISRYRFVDNQGIMTPITQDSFKRHCKFIEIDSFNEFIMPWTRVAPILNSSNKMYACFVPLSNRGFIQTSWGAILGVNELGVPHGKGDFVVCSALPDGSPNFNDRWVVNGLIFRDTYNNRGFTKYLDMKSVTNGLSSSVLPFDFSHDRFLLYKK